MKDTHKQDSVSPKAQDSVFYAKEGKQKPKAEPLIQSGAGKVQFRAAAGNSECCQHYHCFSRPISSCRDVTDNDLI